MCKHFFLLSVVVAGTADIGVVDVIRHRRVPAITARAHMGGDPLALAEQFDGRRRDARLDLLPRKAVWQRVIMPVDFDVIVEAGAPNPPFGEDVTLRWQRLECRAVDLPEQLSPRAPDTTQHPAII